MAGPAPQQHFRSDFHMATATIVSNVITDATAISLAAGDDLVVAASATVASSLSHGIVGNGSSHAVTVRGLVSADLVGISLGNENFDFWNSLHIAEGAVVHGGSAGVLMTGGEGLLTNNGEIYGLSQGLSLAISARMTVVNGGTISAVYGVVVTEMETLAMNIAQFTNTGTVAGEVASYYGSEAVDQFINRGFVQGEMRLNGGNDSYDGRAGSIEGKIYAGLGDDRILPGAGEEVVDGQQGFDTLDFRSSAGLRVSLVDDSGNGAALGDSYNAIEQVLGSRTGADTLIGDHLANTLKGFGGADTIRGGAGEDRLVGGADADRLTGGLNHDSFEFTAPDGAADLITDFHNSQQDNDSLLISAPGFGGGLVGNAVTPIALAASQFVSRADNLAQDTSDRFVFRTTDATLWFDVDGKGGAAVVMIADLQAGAVVTAADIFLL